MATVCLPNYTERFQTEETLDSENENIYAGSSSSSNSKGTTTHNTCHEPSPVTTTTKASVSSAFFFSSSTNYQSWMQKLIFFSFTSTLHLLFIPYILSISKFCSAAAVNASPSEIMQNLSGSALLEKIKASTLGPPLDRLKHWAPAAANSLSPGIGMTNFGSSFNSVFNGNAFKYLNVSGKIGTPLDISQSIPNYCEEKQFQCASGDCIPIRFVCDGSSDCPDHSDERLEQCKFIESTCSADQFRCGNGNCIPQKWVCDNEADCTDGSDEVTTLCTRKTCSPEQFQCKSGEGVCIPLSWMCDQNKDCDDGSDEAQCNATCRSDEFTCTSGDCIQSRWRCDGDHDCMDGSDELNCPPRGKCPQGAFTCDSGDCINNRWVCDGDYDCTDHSDEKQNCSTVPRLSMSFCEPYEFSCNDRITCLHSTWVCDGDIDCPGGDDEDPAKCRNVTCRPDQFQCGDHSCIAGHLTCNGEKDCADGSDERDCSLATPPRQCNATTEFNCGGGQCIALDKVCDRRKDCPDGEDEPAGKCGVNECASKNGGCMHRCVDLVVGYECECRKGYKLSGDKRTCVDIDECENPGVCSQMCINEIGGFKCECEAGYMRDPRNHTRCKAGEGHASLLLARRHDIRKIALDHMEMTSIVNSTKSATALDFVFRTGMIFWSDVTTQSIYKAPIDEGNEKTTVLKQSSVTSDGLAVDWIYNHVYYTDTHKCTIELTNFDGNMGKVLIEDALDIPRSIALDPIEGWMYWSDWGASPRIERAGMDGSHRTTIISYDVKWPNGITLDLVRKRIYWVDGKLNVISSANYDGSQRRQILYSTEYLRHPFSITTFEDYIYWTDWDKQTVFKANKFTGENVEPITAVHMLQNPMVIHVYHPYRQPDGINHCQSVNGHCSHLCLPAPRINERSPRISCACPTGLRLMSDGLMCVEELRIKVVRPTVRSRTKNATLAFTTKPPQDAHTKVPVEKKTNDSSSTHTIHKIDAPAEEDHGRIAWIVIDSLLGTTVVACLILFTYRRCTRAVNSMNFENPVYHKTPEDHFSLEKNVTPHMYATAMDEESANPLCVRGTQCV
ncbi:low-density lipoprotein receptor isoform X4 [Drosophila obscura]|nr:low-density lipoprotein receptor isoform X4 [Drosophila obscura]